MTVYGVSREKAYEPAGRAAVPAEETWDSGAYLRYFPTVVEAVRSHVGDELDEQLALRHPYETTYLPVATRRRNLTDW